MDTYLYNETFLVYTLQFHLYGLQLIDNCIFDQLQTPKGRSIENLKSINCKPWKVDQLQTLTSRSIAGAPYICGNADFS